VSRLLWARAETIAGVAFLFLYLAFRALLGALVRSRRGLDVKDLELLVLRHELEVLRRQVARPQLRAADRALLAATARHLCHPPRAVRDWPPRGRCCVGIGRWCAGNGGSRPAAAGVRPCPTRCGRWWCGWRGRIRAGGIGGSSASLANSAYQYRLDGPSVARPPRAWAGSADVRSELARVSERLGGEHRRLRLLHRRERVPAPVLRVGALHPASGAGEPEAVAVELERVAGGDQSPFRSDSRSTAARTATEGLLATLGAGPGAAYDTAMRWRLRAIASTICA
jgi:hypothetical protein